MKFSSSTDTRPVVKAEAAAMLLAARAGMTVAPVEVSDVGGKASQLWSGSTARTKALAGSWSPL